MRLTQFWDKPTPPEEVRLLISTWQADKRFDHQLFDIERARCYLSEHLGAEVLAAFDKCRLPAMKADLFRYCSLYVGGGAYVDADIGNLGTAYDFFSARSRGATGLARLLPGREAKQSGVLMYRVSKTDGKVVQRLTNDLMIAHGTRSPLFEAMIGIACSNIADEVSENVWVVTGPGIVTKLNGRKGQQHLFENYRRVAIMEFKRHVQFVWKMDYKQTEDHWQPTVQRQTGKSIFSQHVPAGGAADAGPEDAGPQS